MENDDLFDFELNEDENCWSVTGYYGRSEEVVFPLSYEGKPVKTIGDTSFLNNIRIKRVIIPEGITSIGVAAFAHCTGLTDINLPESLTSIGAGAFLRCTGLTTIKLPEKITSIEDLVFSGCKRLTEIKLPEGLTSIGDSAFYKCTRLTEIKIPEGLTSIGDAAFNHCTELAEINVDENNSVYCSVDGVLFDKAMTTLIQFPEGKEGKYSIPDGIISIGSVVLVNCDLITSISFPQSLLSVDTFWFGGEQLTEIIVSELNPYYCSIDGVLFDKEKHNLIQYPRNKEKTEYAVPDGIKFIQSFAFLGCKRLANIVLPESLELIYDRTFMGCERFKAITLPMNLKYIGERAFEGCPNLETVTLSRKTRIAYKAFEGFTGKLVYRD